MSPLNDRLYKSQAMLTDNRAHVLLQGGAHGVVDEGVETGAEGARTRRAADHVLQDQVPANQEGHELADSHVTVHVGRACGFRYSHSELAITHTCREEKGFILRYVMVEDLFKRMQLPIMMSQRRILMKQTTNFSSAEFVV